MSLKREIELPIHSSRRTELNKFVWAARLLLTYPVSWKRGHCLAVSNRAFCSQVRGNPYMNNEL